MRVVLSASRRTDIPAFYMDWFMACLDRGFFETVNPYNRKKTVVPASVEHIHTLVFWSKDFGPFIRGGYGPELQRRGYHLFFNFTINSSHPLLEPGVPLLEQRLAQLAALTQLEGARAVQWRFDPICFYRDQNGLHHNLADLKSIATVAWQHGIQTCITSFVDLYAKVLRRSPLAFVDPSNELKLKVLSDLQSVLQPLNIRLFLCCENHLLGQLPAGLNITKSSCIPNHVLADIFGGSVSLQRDGGQRQKSGCDCRRSVDVGDYQQHPCYHNCLFCYANPSTTRASGQAPKQIHSHNRSRKGHACE